METINQSNYLGTEKISKLLVKFSIPCILSLIISCLYNIVDQIFVGNMVGTAGNAATGIIFPITVIGWGISLFFGDGAASYLSMALGKGETKKVHTSVGNAVLMSFLSGIIIIAAAYAGGNGLLVLLGAKDMETLQLASAYGNIIYAMIPLALVQNCLASIIRADGSPKVAMSAMFTGAIINIIGDPLLISIMGIEGAAVATILGQFVSFLICASYLFHPKNFKIILKSFIPQKKLLGNIMALGTSSFLTQFTIVVITVINNILLVEYGAMSPYGVVIPLSAFVVIMKLFQIILNIAIGIAAGAQPVVGYNYGAQQYSRVRELLKLILKYTAIVCIIATVFIEVFPNLFIRMFGSDGELYMDFATGCLRIYLSLILFTCLQKVSAIFLQSIGKAHLAAPLSMLRDVLLILSSLIVPVKFGVTGIFWAAPIADVIAFVITCFIMLRVWESLKIEDGKLAGDTAYQTIKKSTPGFIITIAREHGSSGKQIGKILAEKLDIPFYYKEMTALAARESGLDKEFISSINKNAPERLHSLYLSTDVIQQAIVAQDKVIRKIADNGSCVIVGRAADYVLRNYVNVVKVFIYAPADHRVKRIMEVYGDTLEQAKQNVARSDSARATYYKQISEQNGGGYHNYDLMLDSSIGLEESAEIIYNYIEHKSLFLIKSPQPATLP
ncbi:cytidylate kinase family protein [Enterocloster aldenensis]|uniref:cytidylate kinase family protein n=1 Tax=Enterocloster aldenensis TaxID=358742 RepID=UPI0040266B57